TPIKLERALMRMIEVGWKTSDLSHALETLKRLNQASDSARSALTEFAEIYDIEKKYLQTALREVYETSALDIPVRSFDNVPEVLSELKLMHKLALVSIGQPLQQHEKMKNAGIDSTIFSKIIVCKEPDKKPYYQAIAEEFSHHFSDIVVCGDRIAVDLLPAKELGFKTVHMRRGRGLQTVGFARDVDFTITEFPQIKEALAAFIQGMECS
ncbi:MAG: HAD family hydrolase, partial [Anaerolineae bacterium]